ncbi:MAG: GNAT family N-acetyltransferase [Candidatus Omnitrophota bacterium]|nr:MAG: GNAT family N-acetyltransferase [Candidatus Omnitrophota bacterium]
MRDIVVRDKNNQIRLKFLKWDTQFFGLKSFAVDTQRTNINRSYQNLLRKTIPRMHSTFVSAKVPVGFSQTLIDFLFDLDFRYIGTAILLEYVPNSDVASRDIPCITDKGVIIEKATGVPKDAHMLGNEFKFSRFHLDKNISQRKADAVWVSYIRNLKLSSKELLFVARYKHTAIGAVVAKQYVSKKGEKISNLFFVAVKRQYQKKCIGSQLIRYAIEWCTHRSDVITVGTQARNIKALNFYIKNGFARVRETAMILHKWGR